MNNPLRIVKAVDARLDRRVELIVFGRAALVLGFSDPPADTLATRDVDGIIPRDLYATFRANDQWWTAIEEVNAELEPEGLYLTHLFAEDQLILRPDWRREVVDISDARLRHLALRRPATIDLVLTKMMRGPDEADLRDVRFYLQREPAIGIVELQAAFAEAVGPDIPEIWELFEAAKPIVFAMAQERRRQG